MIDDEDDWWWWMMMMYDEEGRPMMEEESINDEMVLEKWSGGKEGEGRWAKKSLLL
jgi:hypothetical protein